ncbi:hypothetical protein RclHR1_19910002 [Rhizophagus clarus]|uniref:Uncharacterized protein n=1 Tax=Rhizophagus clarus TaxID=94130 RepID=A0A2Z6R3M9_9GLOM|nr:hypothetical protein RclHR1_19910002 [Rhizophagus clarus]
MSRTYVYFFNLPATREPDNPTDSRQQNSQVSREFWILLSQVSLKKLESVLSDEKHDQTFRIKTKMLLNERHDRTFGIKCCQTKSMTRLLELRHDQTFGIKVREGVLPDEKYDQTFEIKVREVLLNKKYNWTFGIKVKEDSIARRKVRPDF